MAVKIKLSRMGKRKEPKYRVVVAAGGTKRDGKYIERIGFYDPMQNPHVFRIDEDKLTDWLSKGAKLTDGVRKLLKGKYRNLLWKSS